MHADVGGARLSIGHRPRRRARAHLISDSGRGLLIGVLALAAVVGFGLVAGRADPAASAATPYAFIGR